MLLHLQETTQQTLTGSYAADGAFQLTGGAGIGKNVAIGEGLRVYGGTELTGALDLNNSADISGALVTHDNVTITADNKEFAIQNGSGADKFTVDTDNGNTDIRGKLDVGGDAALLLNPTSQLLGILQSMEQQLQSISTITTSMTLLLLWVVTQHQRLTMVRIGVLSSVIMMVLLKLGSSDMIDPPHNSHS